MQKKTVTYQELARQAQKKEKHQIVLAIADGKIRELFQTAKEGEEISFLTTADRIGHDTWVRSAVMLLMKAASDVAGSLQKGKLKVEFSIGRGLYCSPRDGRKVDSTFIDQVRERMRELAAQKIPFEKMTKTTDDAIALFESQGMADKVQLFRYRRASCINVYELDGYYDYNYGYMVPDTGYNVFFILYGEGGTGKSVFLHVLEHLVGIENTSSLALTRFANPFAMEELTEKLLNILSDLPTDDGQGNTLAHVEGMLKMVTSGESLRVEKKRVQDTYKSPAMARLVMATNSLPRFADTSSGIWDRARLIPFNVRVRGEGNDNPHLKDELVAEKLPGILNFALAGLKELRNIRQTTGRDVFPILPAGIAGCAIRFEAWPMNILFMMPTAIWNAREFTHCTRGIAPPMG